MKLFLLEYDRYFNSLRELNHFINTLIITLKKVGWPFL